MRTTPAYKETIVSLTPALPGWRALSVGVDDDGDGFQWVDDVACWALTEVTSDGFRFVQALVADEDGLDFAESYRGQFLKYLSPCQEPDEFAAQIAERQAELRAEARGRGRAPAGPSPNGRRTPAGGRAS